jgi:hypothetical protein
MPAEIPDGAVIIARSILNSSLWTMRVEDRIVALTCIALCNRRRKKWFDGTADVVIERGQFIRSREKLAEACNLPLQVVRTSIDHLESSFFRTRRSTRDWTLYTLPKYQHYQDLTKYSDIVGENLTQDLTRSQPAANHKQQQHTPSTSHSFSDSRRGDPGRNGSVVVVMDPDKWADPILSRPSYRFSLQLLEELKMAKSVAMTIATQKPVGIVLRVVEHAKHQRKPAGWARMAFENGWALPEAPLSEVSRAIETLKAGLPGPVSTRSDSMREKFPKKSGESDDQWFKRVSQELVSTKKGVKKS